MLSKERHQTATGPVQVRIDEGHDESIPEATDAPALCRCPRVYDESLRTHHEPDPGTCCPDCGGDLRVVGDDVSKLLDIIAARIKTNQSARIKKSCRRRGQMVQKRPRAVQFQASWQDRTCWRVCWSQSLIPLTDKSMCCRSVDHLPLYRQHEIFVRMGADISESTLAGWCGCAMKTLSPLIERIKTDIMGSDLLHTDDTPIRVLDRSKRNKGLGKGVKKGRIWAYVRDQRPWAGTAPPRAVYRFAPNWKEEHVLTHLAGAYGT